MSGQGRRSSLYNIEEFIDRCSNEEPDSLIYDADYPNDVADTRAKSQIPDLQRLYKCLVENCTKIGLPPDMINERVSDLDDCINTFFRTIDQDLQDEFEKMCRYKQSLLDQVQKMLSDLYLAPYEQEENLTLLQACKRLKTKFNELNVVKEKRLTRLQELKDKQTRHCLVLGIQAPQIKMQTDIPTEFELDQLARAVRDLETEENKRKEKYELLKELIWFSMDELEYEPKDDAERNILTQIPNYTESHLMFMTSLHANLESLISQNKQKYQNLKDQLNSLYERLDIPLDERNSFLSKHDVCKPSIMREMEVEIDRYMELKKQNIGKFIDKIKDELASEYDRCFLTQEQQDSLLSSLTSLEYSEETLMLYERELERIKTHFKENQEMLEKFQDWRQLWKKLIDFELKTNDPNRFYNRNCKLLEEEKERKRLQRNLPKVEKELKALNDTYAAKNNGKKFKVFDTNIDEFMSGCWDELNTAKEEEKKERQRAKMMGKPNATPAKRPPSATRGAVPPKRNQQSATKATPKQSFRMGPGQRAISASNGSMVSALSLSEPEFENIIVNCPSSKRTVAHMSVHKS